MSEDIAPLEHAGQCALSGIPCRGMSISKRTIPRRIGLHHLEHYVSVAECENIKRAAKTLGVSQPSLSRKMRDLELYLGLDLFERGAKSIILTEAGRAFHQECKAVMKRVAKALDTVSGWTLLGKEQA